MEQLNNRAIEQSNNRIKKFFTILTRHYLAIHRKSSFCFECSNVYLYFIIDSLSLVPVRPVCVRIRETEFTNISSICGYWSISKLIIGTIKDLIATFKH